MRTPFLRPLASAVLLIVGLTRLEAKTSGEAPTPTSAAGSPSFALVGFATVPAYGVDQLTGGAGGPVIAVRTASEFQTAAERGDITKKADRDNTPRIIKVIGDIDLGPLANEKPGNELKSVGKVEVRSNTTIYGAGADATIRHGVLEMHGAHNVIIRNLNFRDLWENDPTGAYDRFGWDYVRITNSGRTISHHIWVDHCDFGKCYDGQLDITHGSDLVTVSWCRFAGDEHGPHKKSMLIGHSSSPAAAAIDAGRLNVTLHHNWIENINDRAPRVRFGNVHAFDNFVDGAENATISVMRAVTLVENCVYRDARVATTFSHAKDSVARDQGGTLCIVDSRNLDPRVSRVGNDPDRAFELAHNFKGNIERAALRFNPPADWTWADRNALPYAYTSDPADAVTALVTRFAGTGKLAPVDLGTAP